MSLPIPLPIVPAVVDDILTFFGFGASGRDVTPYLFIVLTIATWPIAYLLRYIQSSFVRFWLSAIVGLSVMILTYGVPMVVSFWMFCSIFYLPANYRWLSPGLITVIVIIFILAIHSDAMLSGTATDRFSFTGTVMIMAAKISIFSFHLDDGRKKNSGEKLSEMPHIAHERDRTAITVPVSYLQYMGYMFEFLGGVVGPVFGYQEYHDFIHRVGDFKGIDSCAVFRPFLRSVGRAFLVIGLYVSFLSFPMFHHDTVISPWFLTLPFWTRLPLTAMILAVARMAFYAVWSLTEVTCVAAGIAYDIRSHTYCRATNAKILEFEKSQNANQMTACWNMRISKLWLKQCIYERVNFGIPRVISRKALANLLTKLTSALWHGWFVGYYVSFLSLGLANWTESVVRKRIHPHIPERLLHSRMAHVVAWLHTWICVNVFFGPFLLLTWDRVRILYSDVGLAVVMYQLSIIAIASWAVPKHKKKHAE
jgi:lysophospholipid acyltransferase